MSYHVRRDGFYVWSLAALQRFDLHTGISLLGGFAYTYAEHCQRPKEGRGISELIEYSPLRKCYQWASAVTLAIARKAPLRIGACGLPVALRASQAYQDEAQLGNFDKLLRRLSGGRILGLREDWRVLQALLDVVSTPMKAGTEYDNKQSQLAWADAVTEECLGECSVNRGQ